MVTGRGGACRDVMLLVPMRLKEVRMLLLPCLGPGLTPTPSISLHTGPRVWHLTGRAFLVGMLGLIVVLEVGVA